MTQIRWDKLHIATQYFMLQHTHNFTPNLFFRNKHFNTLYRYFRTKIKPNYKRERLTTADGDFIDLDIASVGAKRVIITIHGLEGSANSSYIRSLAHIGNTEGFDVVAVNLKGCSGTPNLALTSYHSGKTDDLIEIIQHIENTKNYTEINLVGFSLGGNIVLKFMGEFATSFAEKVQASVAVSVPCDLKCSAQSLRKWSNSLYQYNFLQSLRKKAKYKISQFPKANLDKTKIEKAKTFAEFDNYFTAITHGFKDADEYWSKSSSKQFLNFINKPTLLISALNDPFLSKNCYPFAEAKEHEFFHLLTPKYGGHVGFYSSFKKGQNYWLERQIINFLTKKII